jgi:transcriptional regulator with XRE-family HTH domain
VFHMTPVGSRIRSMRQERQLTLPALAATTGLSKGLLSKLENDKDSNPSLATLYRVAKGLNVTLSDLLDSGKIQALRFVPEEPPFWLEPLIASLNKEGKNLDEDVLQALYVLQSRKGESQSDASAWLYMYKSLELNFRNAAK